MVGYNIKLQNSIAFSKTERTIKCNKKICHQDFNKNYHLRIILTKNIQY